jgi:hypothetical protein
MANGNPIGVSGGNSISIEFHKGTFVEDPTDPNKHKCDHRTITKVVITDSSGHPTEVLIPDGKCTILIHHK